MYMSLSEIVDSVGTSFCTNGTGSSSERLERLIRRIVSVGETGTMISFRLRRRCSEIRWKQKQFERVFQCFVITHFKIRNKIEAIIYKR